MCRSASRSASGCTDFDLARLHSSVLVFPTGISPGKSKIRCMVSRWRVLPECAGRNSPLQFALRPAPMVWRVVVCVSTFLLNHVTQSNRLDSSLLFAYSKLRPQLQM